MIKRLAIIGVGLIGGSLALALRRAGVVGEVVGAGRQQQNLELALQRGIIDRHTSDLLAAVDGADMVVVAAALGATESILQSIAAALAPNAVVTDVGSAKGSVVAAARKTLGMASGHFVPGHPIAGTERSGAAAAFADLFVDHKVILTPVSETAADATARVKAMWCATGAAVVEMSVEAHDQALAATSHLPHLLAYNLVDTLASRADAAQIFEFAAGGFRDFTRIAASNPTMWAEIALANRDALLAASDDFASRFEQIVAALEANDRVALEALFKRAQTVRQQLKVPESNAKP